MNTKFLLKKLKACHSNVTGDVSEWNTYQSTSIYSNSASDMLWLAEKLSIDKNKLINICGEICNLFTHINFNVEDPKIEDCNFPLKWTLAIEKHTNNTTHNLKFPYCSFRDGYFYLLPIFIAMYLNIEHKQIFNEKSADIVRKHIPLELVLEAIKKKFPEEKFDN